MSWPTARSPRATGVRCCCHPTTPSAAASPAPPCRRAGRFAAPRSRPARPRRTRRRHAAAAAAAPERCTRDALGRVLGAEVQVAPKGDGYKVTLAFASLDEAMALAERLGAVEPA